MIINAQAQVGVEQYLYVNKREMMALVPIVNFESYNHWYFEGRYNYEEMKTFSFYVGRSFSKKDNLTYSIIPMLGGVVGRFKGGSAGVNAVVEYQRLFFSTQSQYTRSFHERNTDFLFAWSELAYQPWQWFYFGLSTQQTYLPKIRSMMTEPGVMLGLTLDRWTFPLYYFNSTSNKYFVVGINYSSGSFKRNR
jgi:hypothetical protein